MYSRKNGKKDAKDKKVVLYQISKFVEHFVRNPENTYQDYLSRYNEYHKDKPELQMTEKELFSMTKKLSRNKILLTKQEQNLDGTFRYVKDFDLNALQIYANVRIE